MKKISLVDTATEEILHIGPIAIRVLEDGSRTDNRLGVVEVSVPAHTAQTPLHAHRMHDETFLVLRGKVRFSVGDGHQDAAVGDLMVVPVHAPHTFSNPFDEPAVFLNTFTPAFYVNYFRELAAILGTAAATSDKLLAMMARYATEPCSGVDVGSNS
ncbi:MAG TPA: cupin domain-containing protein [Polyangiaceae bacterium]|nr:cupin domain-containing protein [Polyangiaceae bacterium]